MGNVKFLSVQLRSTFDALEVKNSAALYWIEETQELYKGSTLFGTGALASEKAAGLLSPEDYASLKALIGSGGGIDNLRPIDGSVIIAKEGDGATIKVGLSAVDGNMLTMHDDGLFVAEVKIPEYTIEKQETAEDGFAATYKLKMTLDGMSSFVGDSINIVKDLMINKGSLEIVKIDGIPYESAIVGDPYIDLVLNDTESSHIYIPVKGLVDTYVAGDGIEIVNSKISVKLAENSHGLVAVDGALALNLATRKTDGAMSKEDKLFVDSIPYAYVARKYDISDAPIGTIVNYSEKEIRVMCPADAEFTKQSVGVGGNANTYYMTFKTYAPNDNVVGYIEHLGNNVDAEILTDLKVDAYGRKYQPTWLGIATYDGTTDTWSYYGANSSVDKYIGWDYQIDWYNADGVMVASDSVRINLSNEDCHNDIKPYYMANYSTSDEVDALEKSISDLKDGFLWSEI